MLPVLGPAYRALRQWLAGLLPARRQGDPSLPVLYLIAVLALAAGDIATRLGWGMAAGLLAVPVFAGVAATLLTMMLRHTIWRLSDTPPTEDGKPIDDACGTVPIRFKLPNK